MYERLLPERGPGVTYPSPFPGKDVPGQVLLRMYLRIVAPCGIDSLLPKPIEYFKLIASGAGYEIGLSPFARTSYSWKVLHASRKISKDVDCSFGSPEGSENS